MSAVASTSAGPVASGSGDKRPTKRARLSAEAAEAREQLKLAKAQPYARIDLKKDFQSLQGPHKNKKLQSRLATLHKSHQATAISSFEHDDLLLPSDNAGLLEPENDVERTWRITQVEIKKDVGVSAAAKGFDLKLDSFGPYSMDYTSNGRCVLLWLISIYANTSTDILPLLGEEGMSLLSIGSQANCTRSLI